MKPPPYEPYQQRRADLVERYLAGEAVPFWRVVAIVVAATIVLLVLLAAPLVAALVVEALSGIDMTGAPR